MNLEITNKKENLLLGRTEVEFQLSKKTTPSRSEIKGLLAKSLKAKEDLIIIDTVDQKMGLNVATGKAKVYKDKKALAEVGLAYKKKRTDKSDEKQAKPAPAEPKQEAPAEPAQDESTEPAQEAEEKTE